MSSITNRFKTQLHEFIEKLSRNFETNKVNEKSLTVILSIWSKHLSQIKNSKVDSKVESFISEMFSNIGVYFMNKHGQDPTLPPLGRISKSLTSLAESPPQK
jgi:hypothetical protein